MTLVPGETYPLAKEQLVQHISGKIERQVTADSSVDRNALQVIYEVDPSNSGVEDENLILAEYLNSSYLAIDMFDADSRFLYGTTKLPLQELLR